MHCRALAHSGALCTLLAALCLAIVAGGNAPAGAQPGAPSVIERPQWQAGDWWEFKRGNEIWRLTVMAREGQGYLLAKSGRGEVPKAGESRRRYLTDVDGWITKVIEPDGTTSNSTDKTSTGRVGGADSDDKYEWVKFPLSVGSRWSFKGSGIGYKGRMNEYDYECRAEGWETIEVAGKSYRAMKIAITHTLRRHQETKDFTAWYVPEAKRLVRLTSHAADGARFEISAFGSASAAPVVVAAAPPPPPTPAPPAPATPAVTAPRPMAVAGNRLAVVIGIGAYQHAGIPKLRYAARDAEAMSRTLIEDAGFKKEHVLLVTDHTDVRPTLRNIKSALGTFLARSATKDDTVFVFFAGHGAPEIDQRGIERDGLAKYLIPSDADPEDLYATALSMDEIQTIFGRIEAERIVVFVDACYSGAVGGRTFASKRLTTRAVNVDEVFLDRLTRTKGRAIITASRPSEVSIELEELGHGVFTYFLVEGLKGAADLDRDGIVTLHELYTYLEREVSKKSRAVGGNQHPVMKGELEGPFPLVSVKQR